MRLFTDIIGEVRNRRLVDQATRQLNELTLAVKATGKAGSLILELKVKPGKDEGEIAVVGVTKLKLPTVDIPEAIFFADEHGNLVRTDPRQGTMQGIIREVAEDRRTQNITAAG